MVTNNKEKYVKIVWNDAKMFSPKNRKIELSIMETTGFLEVELDDYFIVKNPITIEIRTGKRHPEQTVAFYLIPKGMVENIEYK